MEGKRLAPGSSGFGTLLRRYRMAAGLSQEALAERARISANGLSALERGVRRTPQRETLALLVKALELSSEQRRDLEAAAVRPALPRSGRASVTAGPWPEAATSNLPLSLTSFVGRETELEEIVALARNHRFVTIVGAGGIGKTRMALEVGRALGDSAGEGVWLVELAPLRDAALVASAIGSVLAVQEVTDHPLLDTLAAYLKNKKLLLIIDNCEHVVRGAERVVDTLLHGCPELRILATSREALRVAGEHSYRLPSLAVPSQAAARELLAADADGYGAIALFVERALAVDHRFTLSDENAPVVAEICRRLDGIPLAIELAAARATVLPLPALAEKLERRFAILRSSGRMALPRQQTMRATIDWSYDLLDSQEQWLFERLSVFAGSCTFEAATAVCAEAESAELDVFEPLSSLVDKSLVVAELEGSAPRYRLLESFREYAREKLVKRGELNVVLRRHALVYLELAERFERAYGSASDEWRMQAQQELDNWRAALEWAFGAGGDVELGQQLAGALYLIWGFFVPLEGRRWISAALALVDERTPRTIRAALSLAEAEVAGSLGQSNAALRCGEAALLLYRVSRR